MKACGSMEGSMAMAKRRGQTRLGLKAIIKMIRSMAKGFCF